VGKFTYCAEGGLWTTFGEDLISPWEYIVAHQKEIIEIEVWTRERMLADLRLVLFVMCIGVTMFLTIRAYLTPH
jgi:hypothetical protein